ncbi:MAG: GNAT family N-acetyltransferase [Bacteroidota bacterium]
MQFHLEDELIILRPLQKDDFDALYQVAKDPLIWEQHPCSDRYQQEKFRIFFEDSIESKGAFVIIDKSNSSIIGSTRFKKIKRATNAIEIGWTFLARDKWGGVYNRTAKKLMIDYALEHLDYVVFYVDKNNQRSIRAVQKLGAVLIEGDLNKSHLSPVDSNLTFRIGKDELTRPLL